MSSFLSAVRNRLLSGVALPSSSRAVAPSCLTATTAAATNTAHFSTSQTTQAAADKKMTRKQKKELADGVDLRIKHIRYHRDHGALKLVPRPLAFPRIRSLRHWTISRAWSLYTTRRRQAQEAHMRALTESMWAACEELRMMDGHGRRIGVDVEPTPQLERSIKKAADRENAALDAAAELSESGRASNTELEMKERALEKQLETEDSVLPLDKQIGKLYRKAMSKKGIWRGFPIEATRIQTDYPPTKGWNKEWRSI